MCSDKLVKLEIVSNDCLQATVKNEKSKSSRKAFVFICDKCISENLIGKLLTARKKNVLFLFYLPTEIGRYAPDLLAPPTHSG